MSTFHFDFSIADMYIPLANAIQSSTIQPFVADNAIDGISNTGSRTLHSANKWWSVELLKTAKISTIQLFVSLYRIENGYFNQVKVSTRMSEAEKWRVCKDTFSMGKPNQPHDIHCDRPTTANYLRIDVYGGKDLRLTEVNILESMYLLVNIIPFLNLSG